MHEKEKLTIKSWALDDRPREKLLSKGILALSDAELIAILIGSGNKSESAVALSKRILKESNASINELAKLSVEKLMLFKGIGEAKAITIITALELGKRRRLETALEKSNIHSSKDAANIMQPIIGDLQHEEFWVLFLNNSNKVVAQHQISKGGLTATVVDVRLLFKRALELASVAIIICHNHPSGKLQPSTSDKNITQKIKEASITLDIKLLDHIIITEKTYFSFADEGIL
ncbi:RadC family protein [Polaribacter tangerinus]|uniref:RadC family protein n=1 Tax=Polaribacter tangerinus TaxID=1920034 RepID=UPI000B4BDAD5|nr:DNA repair protein RadC [Polaribacter tangerinus]